jgi:DNA-directed RNA polymerase specialized sigma24 family protein
LKVTVTGVKMVYGVGSTNISVEEKEEMELLRTLTDESEKLKAASMENARQRREVVERLRKRDWSLRRIGDVIGISGQRVDSMLKMKEKHDSLNGNSAQ